MSKKYKILKRLPTIIEYKKLCKAVGWTEYMNFDVAEESLNQSVFGVVIQYEDEINEIVGMGRVVGDGKIYFYIQDIAVMPEHQNKGLGHTIMGVILEFLKENAPEKSFVGLFASKGKESFYNKYGFNKHDGMTGMFGVIHERKVK
ncbi:GNAT family N-acetyltransferase [Paenibacillus thiaminolyticus]|uniref:GNAT family N-acetyltransferase n=1 Tax=Paenibacillus thiaminolyticus TaxID=49283 RepID=UPI00232CEF66|nr:GNAT family N-acetyltransferase [Paenibacillus thiaminolyticus]WCF10616.1 GNAT family N-acetyltransferase [Paenibacillus thiaminolyticus]